MRILYLNPNGTLGGAERALMDLMQAVRQARPDGVLDLVTGSEGDFTAAARGLGIDVRVLLFPAAFSRLGDAGAGGPAGDAVSKSSMMARLAGSTPELINYGLKLRRLLRNLTPDVIHSNGFKTHILAAWAAPRRSKLIWHVHDYVSPRPLMSRLMRAHASRCDVALANSHSVAQDLAAVCGKRLKIRTVYNAVDLERFNPRGPVLDLDALCGLPPAKDGTVRVGLVATMARWKGQEVFLRALSMLPNITGRDAGATGIRGYIIGGPIYATAGSQYSIDELRNLATGLGLNGNTGFAGHVSDPAAAMRALDVVVHASTQPEPFGLVVAEAMACGKPLIASKAGGVNEIVSENETALTHSPGDAAGLAACIARLSDDSGLREKLHCWGLAFRRRTLRPRPARAASTPNLRIPYGHSVIRVLHIVPGKLFGGVETAIITLSRFGDVCPEMATEVAVCFEDRLSDELIALGVPVHVLGKVRVRNPLTVRRARHKLRNLLCREGFDVVLCHMPWVQAIFGPVVRSEGITLAFRAHGASDGRHWIERWAARTRPDIAICVSHFVAASLEKLYPDLATEVVYNAVAPVEALSPMDRIALRAEAGASPNSIVIAQAGRMQPGKGQQVLLEALALLRELPDWQCWQIGEAQSDSEQEYLSALRQHAVRLAIKSRVHFWGQRKDVSQLLAAADIYCQPNDTFLEGMGIAFVEAMRAGLPVVTADIGAAPEVVDHTCGFLLGPGDIPATAATLEKLILDPNLRAKLASGGPPRVDTLFAPEIQIPRLYEALGKALSRKQVPTESVNELGASG